MKSPSFASFRAWSARALHGVALLLFSVATVAAPRLALAQSRTWHVASGSRVQFVSDASLERITGTSSTVNGEVTFDPTSLGSVSGRVAVPVSSLRTGSDLRDEHLRSDSWLDAASHPDATLEITSIEGASALRPGEVVRVTIHGRFSIHGHTNDITASAQVRWMEASEELAADGVHGDLVRAQARFAVELPDYGVEVNSLVRLQVSDHILVNVTLRLTSD